MDRYSTYYIGRFPWLFCIIGSAIIIIEVFSLLAFEEKINRVAEKAIDIDMFAMGNVDGNQSRACVSVNMDYWGIDSIPNNHITIRHMPQINFPNDTVANILKKALKSCNINANMVHGFIPDSVSSIYVIKYKMYSDELSKFVQKESGYTFQSHTAYPSTVSITKAPYKLIINGEACIAGDCVLTFGNTQSEGHLNFNTNVDNQYPKYNQFRNLSALRLKTNISSNIPIDTIEFNFFGGTRYSDITPEPDYINGQYVRYTSSQKINYILTNGLDFECEFKQTESRQNGRSTLIWFLITTSIGYIGYLIRAAYKIHLFNKASNSKK